jgi:hypothetical protein
VRHEHSSRHSLRVQSPLRAFTTIARPVSWIYQELALWIEAGLCVFLLSQAPNSLDLWYGKTRGFHYFTSEAVQRSPLVARPFSFRLLTSKIRA